MSEADELTALLVRCRAGDKAALDRVIPVVYTELHRLAQAYLRRERAEHTLQPTALLNELYLRLVDQRTAWQNRAHFFGIAAQLMRRILVDHARQHGAAKRAGEKVSLDASVPVAIELDGRLLAIDAALERLAAVDPAQARLVELRYFGGLTIEETADVLGVSPSTVKREWTIAKAWLYRELA